MLSSNSAYELRTAEERNCETKAAENFKEVNRIRV